MQFRSTPRAESPSHQQLYKRDPSSPIVRRRSSITPSRYNGNGALALTVVQPGNTSYRGSAAAGSETVYVADVNPVYSVDAAVRCFTTVNDRVMWSGEYNGFLCVRALPKGTSLRTLPGREGTCCISLLCVSAGERVWAGFQDGYLHIYDAKTMDLVKATMAHSGGLNCMTEVEDLVFTGGADWRICQWNCENGAAQLLRTLHGHRGGVRSFGVYDGPTGAVLFSGSDDGTIRAWNPYVETGSDADSEAANIHTFAGHVRAVLSVVVVSHVNQLWSGGEDMTVRVWDLQTLECLGVLRGGHTAPIANLMVVESRVWSADKHGHILLWDITTRSLLQDLADRVPYWGMGQGMILAMQKVQPTSAYKVWTASSNGIFQCWNAETIPIVFDDVSMASGVCRPTGAPAIAAAGTTSSPRRPTRGRAASSVIPLSADAGKVSALTVLPENACNVNDGTTKNDAYGCGVAASRTHEYVQRLQQDLQNAQRDATLNYEKYRIEVQLEIETQQLLAQENERLRDRLRELEEIAGVPHEEIRAEPTGSMRSARHNDPSRMSASVGDVGAMTAEMEALRKQLEEAHQQLSEALYDRQKEQLDAVSAHGESLRSPELGARGAPPDPAHRFVRQDDFVKLPSIAEDALSDSTALGHHSGAVGGAAFQFSAFLSTPHESQWVNGAITRTFLSRHFNGENWEYLMNEKPYELHSTLTADLCAGLGVAPTQLERVDLHNGSLAVEVDVVHPATVPSSELERRMREYHFPGIMKMHADAFTTTKISPDTAKATIIDLQEQLANLQKQLEEAQEEQTQARAVEPSPEPQQPYSNARPNNSNNGASAAVELQRLKNVNTKLQDKLQDQLRRNQQLKDLVENREGELAAAQAELKKKDDALKRAQQQLKEAQEQQLQQTPDARQQCDSVYGFNFQGQRLYDSAAPPPPAVDGTARKKAGSESSRPTELIAIPLAGEMSSAGGSQERQPSQQQQRASGGVPQGEEAVDTQRVVAQLQQSLKEACDKIAALEAEKKNENDATAVLRRENARLTQQADTLKMLPPKLAAAEKQSKDLQQTNDTLAGNIADLKKKIDNLEEEVKAGKQKLAAAAAASPSAVAKGPEKTPAAASTSNDSTNDNDPNGADPQRLREDHEALKNYLHDQLKPLISSLKRANGELQLDVSRIQENLQHACDMYDEAVAALEEARVREEKMGETVEALQKALEAEHKKNQGTANTPAYAVGARLQSETPAGRPTEPAQLCSGSGAATAAAVGNGVSRSSPSPLQEESNLHDAIDRMAAQNLSFSVRLADAEAIIAHLQDALEKSADQLAEQRVETQRLLGRIEKYQQRGRDQSDKVLSVSTSDSLR